MSLGMHGTGKQMGSNLTEVVHLRTPSDTVTIKTVQSPVDETIINDDVNSYGLYENPKSTTVLIAPISDVAALEPRSFYGTNNSNTYTTDQVILNSSASAPYDEFRLHLPFVFPTTLFSGIKMMGEKYHQRKFFNRYYSSDNDAGFHILNPDAYEVFFNSSFTDADFVDNDHIGEQNQYVFFTPSMLRDYINLSAKVYNNFHNEFDSYTNLLKSTAPWRDVANQNYLLTSADPYLPSMNISRRWGAATDISPNTVTFRHYNKSIFVDGANIYITYIQDVEVKAWTACNWLTYDSAFPEIEDIGNDEYIFWYNNGIFKKYYDVMIHSQEKTMEFRAPMLAHYEIQYRGDGSIAEIDLIKASCLSMDRNEVQTADVPLPGGTVYPKRLTFSHTPFEKFFVLESYDPGGKYQKAMNVPTFTYTPKWARDNGYNDFLITSTHNRAENLLVNVIYTPYYHATDLNNFYRGLTLVVYDLTNPIPEIPKTYLELEDLDTKDIIGLDLTNYNNKYYLAVSISNGLSYVVEIDVTNVTTGSGITASWSIKKQFSNQTNISIQGINNGGML